MTTFKAVMSGVALAGATALLTVGALADGPSDHQWKGFYLGVNAGWAWGDVGLNTKVGCTPVNEFDWCPIQGPAGEGFVGSLGTGSTNVDGFIGGVQAGYLWQQGKMVFGYEIDFNSFNLGGSVVGTGLIPDGSDRTAVVGTSFSADWLATFRGRLGVTLAPKVLAYATGGLALTDLRVANSYHDNGIVNEFGQRLLEASGASSGSKLRVGWTVGAGLEWALDNHWTIRGEYLYVDFGSISTFGGIGILDSTKSNFDTSGDLTAHIGRAAISYKF